MKNGVFTEVLRTLRGVAFAALACLSCLSLAGCGFQLQGDHIFPFKRLYLTGAPSPAMAARLKRLIEAGSDTRIVTTPAEADATLAMAVGRGQNVLSFDLQGVAQEYELTTTLSYSLTAATGAVLIPPSRINVNRAMTYSTTYALAKSSESALLNADMDNDLADQLVRRLDVVQSISPAATPVPGVAPRSPLPTPPL